MKPRASALSASSEARRSKKRLAVYIDTHEALRAEVARINRQKRIDRFKRVFLWPAHVLRS